MFTYVNFIKMFGSNIGKLCFFTSNIKLENKFSKGESMRHEILSDGVYVANQTQVPVKTP